MTIRKSRDRCESWCSGRQRRSAVSEMRKAEIEAERDEARRLARLLHRWCYWLDAQMNTAYCAQSMAQLEEYRADPDELAHYEEWRKVRESGMLFHHPWLGDRED